MNEISNIAPDGQRADRCPGMSYTEMLEGEHVDRAVFREDAHKKQSQGEELERGERVTRPSLARCSR